MNVGTATIIKERVVIEIRIPNFHSRLNIMMLSKVENLKYMEIKPQQSIGWILKVY